MIAELIIAVVYPVCFVFWLFGGGVDAWLEAEEESIREIEKYID